MRQMLLSWLLSAAPVIFLGHAVNAQEEWVVDGAHSCSGMETDWETCPGLPPCDGCQDLANHIDCLLSEWSDWSEPSDNRDCFGLCYRKRNITQQNNHCGKACSGTLEDTKVCPRPSHCPVISKDCILGQWKDWNGCTHHDSTDLGQNTRFREIIQPAMFQGKTCENELAETVACGKREHVDCLWDQWAAWTSCSQACGGGHQTRTREIEMRSKGIGAPCVGESWQEAECNSANCDDIAPCKVGAWSMWSGCDVDNPHQKKRERYVTSPAISNGISCTATLHETAPCNHRLPSDCTTSAWTTWSDCTKTCEGGSMQRTRAKATNPQNGGSCPVEAMTEVTVCNNVSCTPPSLDCKFGAWSAWGSCSVTCGVGSQDRHRSATVAMPGGTGCADALKQTKPCQGTLCVPADCTWSQWSDWDACDASCDGGVTRRWRDIQTPASKGGQCLPVVKGEIKQCNTIACQNCTNGTWNLWGEWSTCSASCGDAYRSRTRSHKVAPSSCGFPAEGNTKEYQVCSSATGQPSCAGQTPCQLGDWEEWTECSSTCTGMQRRKRQVVSNNDAASSCTAPLAEMAACFKGSEQQLKETCHKVLKPLDCHWGSWDSWSKCSVTCGAGLKERRRVILQYAVLSGAACQGPDKIVADCSVTCPDSNAPKNCEVGQWSSWSGCAKHSWPDTKPQKTRTRQIVQYPDRTGQPCASGTALSQTTSCVDAGKDTISLSYCAWSPWAAWSSCPATCTGARTRTRKQYKGERIVQAGQANLTDLYNTFTGPCTGVEVEQGSSCKACKKPTCFPMDLGLSEWSPWITNSSTELCTRSRQISQAKSPCGQYIGLGSTTQTKPCPTTEHTVCKFGPNYSPATKTCETITDQITTNRIAPTGFPFHCMGLVGSPKENPVELDKTNGCVSALKPKRDCTMGAWTDWSVCSDTANSCNGLMTRTRTWTPAQSGGVECTGSTREQKECTGCVHNGVCHFSDWSSWAVVGSDEHQAKRTRKALPQNSAWTTAACQGGVEEVKANDKNSCSISTWSDWSTCSTTCGQGHVSRTRVASKCGIGSRTVDLEEAKPCLFKYCPGTIAGGNPVACTLGAWGTWSGCSHSCDGGSQTRVRGVATPSANNGQGCTDSTKEERACGTAPCVASVDCASGDWSAWSPCTKSCHGGQMSRTKNLTQWPQGSGQKCPTGSVATQLRPCGVGKCPGEADDAQWGPWVSISECSSTCHGGFKMFKREVKTPRSGSGKEAIGLSQKTEPCNTGVSCALASNCMFQAWTEWSPCASWDADNHCTGTSTRSRGFVPSKNGGTPCNGALNETMVCKKCDGGPPPTCTLGQWSPWSQCNVTCGGGQMTRTRSATDAPLCNGTLHQTAPCGTARCSGTALDCQYSPWQDWGACQVCGGSRTRVRTISQYPHPGGKACENGNLTEVGHCSASCSKLFCAWGEWNSWSACSSVCGSGKRSRTRVLSLKEKSSVLSKKYDDEEFLQDKVQELYRKSHALEARRHHDLLVAFSLGGVAFLALMVVGMVRGRIVPVVQTSCDPSPTDTSLA